MIGSVALLLIDVQKDFLARPGLNPKAEDLLAAIADLLALARARRWPVIHVHTQVAADGSDWMPHWRRAGRADCVEGSAGAEPPPQASVAAREHVVTKRFFSAFENERLEIILSATGARRLIVAGIHTHACIRESVTDAYARGFEVSIPIECVGSYDPTHGALTLEWLDGRAASCVSLSDLRKDQENVSSSVLQREETWSHRNPCDWSEIFEEVPLARQDTVAKIGRTMSEVQPSWAKVPISERSQMLRDWYEILSAERERWIDIMVRDLGKPRRDAEGEFAYGMALLDHVCASLIDREIDDEREVRYRPHGVVALITPWNNAFAIPISKLAPAIGFGNCALWKPALPASRLSEALHNSLARAGLGSRIGLVLGDAATGRAVVEACDVMALSFTGSIAVGREIGRHAARRMIPLQAELGGNNAAIVLGDADIEAAASDLAAAMFSFSGQRCTAIRRLIVDATCRTQFAEALGQAVHALRVGDPADVDTNIGPVISLPVREGLRGAVDQAMRTGAKLLTGGSVPANCPQSGCWLEPTILADAPPDSPVLREELFGPVVALTSADGLEHALDQHNRFEQGLLGSIYTRDPANVARFCERAEAGLLLVNQARPAFSAAGPFIGWKSSGYGPPEHGRWNRDVYTRVQAVYSRAVAG